MSQSHRRRSGPRDDYPKTFLPRSVARAADDAADQVLLEDELLRRLGFVPERGRSR